LAFYIAVNYYLYEKLSSIEGSFCTKINKVQILKLWWWLCGKHYS